MQTETDALTRLGGWLFRHRTALPLPIAAAILTLRPAQSTPSPSLVVAGVALTAFGEALRLWGVRHIGAISRTRSERLGPLVDSGPFGLVRNPLYIGNVALWVGFAVTAHLLWLALAIVVLLGLEYHAIVRWEERLLEARLGDPYRDYASRVPRWWPRSSAIFARRAYFTPSAVSTRATLFSERGTLAAIAFGYVLLWIKLRSYF